MNIHEYQAKKLLKGIGLNIPVGFVAYTPDEARHAALQISEAGPWVVKAQIQAGAREIGKFSDKRAGKKGGVRLSRTIDSVYENADEMLGNMLITNQTSAKGRLVSRVYVEEYIKVAHKYYLGLTVDRVTASVVLLLALVADKNDENIIQTAIISPDKILKINLGIQKELNSEQLKQAAEFMHFDAHFEKLKNFLNKLLQMFYNLDATMLELNPIGVTKKNEIWILDAKIIFDKNALYRHPDIKKLTDDAEIEERELIASKCGFQYKELDNGIGIIVNGDGLALSTINEAKKMGMDTACFLNLKGGVDRDKIVSSIKLIMTNPRVDGIFINILGGFSRCNLIADGIITVANDLGLNIPLVARFEGTNRNEATEILKESGLELLIAKDTQEGLNMLQSAIEEDM